MQVQLSNPLSHYNCYILQLGIATNHSSLRCVWDAARTKVRSANSAEDGEMPQYL